jgi:hypothetical protein
MRMSSKPVRLTVLLMGMGAIAPLALTGAATAATTRPTSQVSAAAPVHGTIDGFATGDFTFLDALSIPSLNLLQTSIAQSAAGVSNKKLQTTDTLGQDLLTGKSASGNNAYGRGAGVSVNLGQADHKVPQVQLVNAEAVSPPRTKTTNRLLNVPLGPLGDVDVQPDTAQANTTSADDFCVLGAPLSEGTGTIADADVLPGLVGKSSALISAGGQVKDDSTEELDPNGAGNFGLNSVATLNTAGITLFKGISPITIKVVNPLLLEAFAGGVPGTSKAFFGSTDGKKDLLSISGNGQHLLLTVEQVLGTAGATIPIVGKNSKGQTLHLANVVIGGEPTLHTSSNGQTATASADLVKVQIINKIGPANVSIGGPLGKLLTPIVGPVVSTLDTVVSQLQSVITSLGLTRGVDLRVGHFEAKSQVPNGGIECGLPVQKSTNKDPVTAGDNFTVTISAHNPYQCTIKDVKVDDHITATTGVKWTVGATRPKADSVSNSEVVWNNIGSIPPGGSRAVQVDISIDSDSAAGQMSDTADVTGSCATGNGPGTTNVNLHGNFTLHAPKVNPAGAPSNGGLPDTGMSPLVPIGGGLLMLTGLSIAVLRRRSVI